MHIECIAYVVAGNQYFLACIARRVNDMEQLPAMQNVEQFVTKQDLTGKILACDTRSEMYSLIYVCCTTSVSHIKLVCILLSFVC